MNKRLDQKAFTLIELLMVIVLVSVLSILSIELISDSINESRFQDTVQKLNQLKLAILGNPEITSNGNRTHFGFIGDVGALPTALQSLSILGESAGLPAYAMQSQEHIGVGWNGPYASFSSSTQELTVDAWGTSLVYDPSGTPPTITSLGGDRVAGGTGLNQDIVVTLPLELSFSEVQGYVCDHGGAFDLDAEVEINYPDGLGNLKQDQLVVTPGQKGYFHFSNIPFGVRSISVYLPDKSTSTQVVGPSLITVDKANFQVPCKPVDINP